MDSGPRLGTQSRSISFPDAYECYRNSDELVVTCLATNFECPDKQECKDKADDIFQGQLLKYAHTSLEIDYFNRFNLCLGISKHKFEDRDLSHKFETKLENYSVETRYEGYSKRAAI